MKNYSELVKTRSLHLLHGQGAMHLTYVHSVGAFLFKNPFYGVRWVRVDKWQRQYARWMIMESSRNFSCDTCLSEFAQG